MDNLENSNIPASDQDRQLSEAYKEALESENDLSGIDDPLFKTLLRIRNDDSSRMQDIAVHGKESSWEAISQTIRDRDADDTETQHRATITPLHTRRKWLKVAAAIILIALSALFLIQQFSSPDRLPVAESSESVQTFELPDGSIVTLRPNSSLYRLTDAVNERAYSLSGEAVFEVVSEPDRIFTVEAGSGRVVVTGTRFNFSGRDETARVYLIEGRVRFETRDGSDSVTLEPGEASEIGESLQIGEPFQFDPDLITGWTENRLTFRDRQAGSIMDELEFHYKIQIVASEEIRQETLGGTIQLDSAEQSLEDLGIVLGGSFEKTESGVYEFRPGDG